MKTVCTLDKCAGCMACVDACPKGAISIRDNLKSYNAVIDQNVCVGCNICHSICQVNHPAKQVTPIKWYQGWASETVIREIGSSGGLATALSLSFVQGGGIVWSCVLEHGQFVFRQAATLEELKKFSGSKYVKSNPSGSYSEIRKSLKAGKRILFIGLPCQVSALRNFVGEKLESNLYTVDLICHGSPSPRVLELFLKQYGYKLSDLKDIRFRKKNHFQTYDMEYGMENYKSIAANGVTDRYLISFLNCLCYTENCYSCNYAKTERVSDITLGDSWGSSLPKEERGKGISLILCQTQKGLKLIGNSRVHLEDVDIKNAIVKNHQLKSPSEKPMHRTDFFDGLAIDEKFDVLVKRFYPKQCNRQELKKWLIRLRLIGG